MIRMFDKHGLVFQYPENWNIEEESVEDGATSVWLYSPGSACWSVTVYPPGVDPNAAIDQVLETMQAEYRGLDLEKTVESYAGTELVGYEMNFVCLDMINTARVQSYRDEAATYVIFCQAEDREYAKVADVFAAITMSLLSDNAGR